MEAHMVTALLMSIASASPAIKTGPPVAKPAIEVRLSGGDRFERGDRVRVYVTADRDGYVVVLHAEPDGRVRVLHRFRDHRQVPDRIVGSLVGEGLLGPRLLDHLQPFEKPPAGLAKRHIEALKVHRQRPTTGTELEAATRQHVQGRSLLGTANRLVQGEDVDGDPQADAPGAAR